MSADTRPPFSSSTQLHLPCGSTWSQVVPPSDVFVRMSPQTLRIIAGLRLPGAPLSTFLALLSYLGEDGKARVTQPKLCELLGTGPGRIDRKSVV